MSSIFSATLEKEPSVANLSKKNMSSAATIYAAPIRRRPAPAPPRAPAPAPTPVTPVESVSVATAAPVAAAPAPAPVAAAPVAAPAPAAPGSLSSLMAPNGDPRFGYWSSRVRAHVAFLPSEKLLEGYTFFPDTGKVWGTMSVLPDRFGMQDVRYGVPPSQWLPFQHGHTCTVKGRSHVVLAISDNGEELPSHLALQPATLKSKTFYSGDQLVNRYEMLTFAPFVNKITIRFVPYRRFKSDNSRIQPELREPLEEFENGPYHGSPVAYYKAQDAASAQVSNKRPSPEQDAAAESEVLPAAKKICV